MLVLRHQEQWARVSVPDDVRACSPEALAAVSMDEFWVAAVCDRRPIFLHYSNGQWTEVPGPPLPGQRRASYFFSAMQFVSADEGWAVGNVSGGAATGASDGLVFHYRDGVWKQRNWNWHFWHERWFGLFGY
jgi:hypothetical protein